MAIVGTEGDDVLIGTRAYDWFKGKGGADTFVLQRDGKVDKVSDFENGVDKIDLTNFGVTWEEVFVFMRAPGTYFIKIRGESTAINVVEPAVGEPALDFFTIDKTDFLFDPGAAAPTPVTKFETDADDVMRGSSLPDVFIFRNNDETNNDYDAIRQFEFGKDIIDLVAYDTGFGELRIRELEQGRILIRIQDAGDEIDPNDDIDKKIVIRDASKLLTKDMVVEDFFLF